MNAWPFGKSVLMYHVNECLRFLVNELVIIWSRETRTFA